MATGIRLVGSARNRAKSVALLGRTIPAVYLRRLLKGPLSPSWNLAAELAAEISRKQLFTAFRMHNIQRARAYLNTVSLTFESASKAKITDITMESFKGSWIIPTGGNSSRVVLFLHGGGYSFYPRALYDNYGTLLALAAGARVFALDYGLAPEHRFPVQLHEAIRAYRWLLESLGGATNLIIAGDSAGGNLALSLLLSIRKMKLPAPAMTVCFSPATDFTDNLELTASTLDWISPAMALDWADWYCSPEERKDPLVSPVYADLHGLGPIFVQAGGAEILLNSIEKFVARAQEQAVEVIFDIWPEMTHDFQAFGSDVPQSVEALQRVGQLIAERVPTRGGAFASPL